MQFKSILISTAAGLMTLAAAATHAQNVGVAVSVNQPGFYGRVEIGQQPPPLIYAQPVIIQQTPVAVVQRPIYLHVPPGHYRHWGRFCGIYRACSQPVYFVQPRAVVYRDGGGWQGPRRWDRGDDDGGRGGWNGWHDHGHDHGHGGWQGHGHGRGHGHGHH